MAKKSQIDLAIEALEAEKAVLDHAIAKLREQQKPKASTKRQKIERTVLKAMPQAVADAVADKKL